MKNTNIPEEFSDLDLTNKEIVSISHDARHCFTEFLHGERTEMSRSDRNLLQEVFLSALNENKILFDSKKKAWIFSIENSDGKKIFAKISKSKFEGEDEPKWILSFFNEKRVKTVNVNTRESNVPSNSKIKKEELDEDNSNLQKVSTQNELKRKKCKDNDIEEIFKECHVIVDTCFLMDKKFEKSFFNRYKNVYKSQTIPEIGVLNTVLTELERHMKKGDNKDMKHALASEAYKLYEENKNYFVVREEKGSFADPLIKAYLTRLRGICHFAVFTCDTNLQHDCLLTNKERSTKNAKPIRVFDFASKKSEDGFCEISFGD